MNPVGPQDDFCQLKKNVRPLGLQSCQIPVAVPVGFDQECWYSSYKMLMNLLMFPHAKRHC